MAESGRSALTRTDATLARFLAGPDQFVPRTPMIISSGPVNSPEARRAIIKLLKRATMPPGYRHELDTVEP